MKQRRPMSPKRSRRNFAKGRKVNPRNFATAMRGGYRI